jgi:hypothetical protein
MYFHVGAGSQPTTVDRIGHNLLIVNVDDTTRLGEESRETPISFHRRFDEAQSRSNTGPGAEKKKLTTSLVVIKQDITAPAWRVEMGREPGADPAVVL